jgi:hypothetical protein
LLILLYILLGKITVVVVAASAGIASFGFDLYRLYPRNRDISAFATRLCKSNRADGFSSATILLFSALSVILVFPRDIALLILSFLVGGGVFRGVFTSGTAGNRLLSRVFLKICLSYFAGALAAGYVVTTLLDLESLLLFLGAAATPIAVLLSGDLEASFPVAVLSGAVMSALGKPV